MPSPRVMSTIITLMIRTERPCAQEVGQGSEHSGLGPHRAADRGGRLHPHFSGRLAPALSCLGLPDEALRRPRMRRMTGAQSYGAPPGFRPRKWI